MSASPIMLAVAGHEIRVPCVPNAHVVPSGFKSYVYALHKFAIRPTRPGPYFMGKQAHGILNLQTLRNIVTKHTGSELTLMKYHPGENHEAGEAGEVEAEDIQHDAMYLCPVQIGTPPQTLNLDFDTGSADLWVFSTSLPVNQRAHHKAFDPSKSTSYRSKPRSTWKITYGDQSGASGVVGKDDVKLGGIIVEDQAIELADTISAQFVQGQGDGLLGLAFSKINTVKPMKVKSPVDNMIAQGDISKNSALFTAYLGSWRDANEADKGESFYTFGYIDMPTLKAAGVSKLADIHYAPIDNSDGFWKFKSSAVTVNGRVVSASRFNTAIADTGTTLALVSDSVCDAIYDAIPGAKYDYDNQGFIFPANTKVEALPVVQIDVGGKMFTIQKEDLGFAPVNEDFVYGGVQSRGELPFDILGDTFLKSIYAIFDQGNKRFGAVQRIEKFQNVTPAPI